VPREKRLWKEGSGLKLASSRSTPDASRCPRLGGGGQAVPADRAYVGAERVQWGAPVAARRVAQMLDRWPRAVRHGGDLGAVLAAAEPSRLRHPARGGHRQAVQLRGGWRIVDDTVQIRGGRGYETARSLAARGDRRSLSSASCGTSASTLISRSSRSCTCSSTRGGDRHLKIAGDLVSPTRPWAARPPPRCGRALLRDLVPARGWAGGHWPRLLELRPPRDPSALRRCKWRRLVAAFSTRWRGSAELETPAVPVPARERGRRAVRDGVGCARRRDAARVAGNGREGRGGDGRPVLPPARARIEDSFAASSQRLRAHLPRRPAGARRRAPMARAGLVR